MDLIGEFRLHDVDNCNEIYCLAFHELRQLKGQLFHSLRVAVPSPPQGETEARERLRKPDSNCIIPLPPFHLRGGEGRVRLHVGYSFFIAWGWGRGPGRFLEDRMVIRGNEGGGGVSVVAKRVYRKVTASEGGGGRVIGILQSLRGTG